MKLKNARNLDARQSMLVDSAYYQCNPPQHSALKRKRRPAVQDWMRHLVFVQLGKDDVRKVRTCQTKEPTALQPCFHPHAPDPSQQVVHRLDLKLNDADTKQV